MRFGFLLSWMWWCYYSGIKMGKFWWVLPDLHYWKYYQALTGSLKMKIIKKEERNRIFLKSSFHHSFRLILLSVLRNMPLQGASEEEISISLVDEDSDCWFCNCEFPEFSWISKVTWFGTEDGGGEIERLNSVWLLCSLDSDTDGRCCLKLAKKWFFEVKRN